MYEENKILIIKSQSGDEKSLEKLIKQNNGLIWSIVRRFSYREIEADDLYQIACIGFIKAVKRFDFNYNVELSTYVVQYIFGEIRKFLRDDGIIKVSRHIKELGLKIKEMKQIYGNDLQISKLSEMLGIKEDEICMAISASKKIESINQYIYEDGSCEIIDKINVENDEENILDKILISDLIDSLGKREKEIIKMRYFGEKTQSQVAKIIGISQVQVSRIERRVLKDLKKQLVRGELRV